MSPVRRPAPEPITAIVVRRESDDPTRNHDLVKESSMASTKPTGICSVCDIAKKLTASGNVQQHKRHDVPCAGSLCPPRPRKSQVKIGSWGHARREVLKRDGKCRKCWASSDLDIHHIKERCDGGTDDLENLIALCSNCHVEWTLCENGTVTFDRWLQLPPMRFVVPLFALDWPTDISADAYKEQILNAIGMLMGERENRRRGLAP